MVMFYSDDIIFCSTLLKWVLILITMMASGTLVRKIVSRKSLHTLFNLGMCFFFFFTGSIFPFMINEYANMFMEMIKQPNVSNPERCYMLYLYRVLINQAMKVFILNLLFRYILIKFSHYGLGLSNSFSHGGRRPWFLKSTYFIFLLTYMGVSFFNLHIKSYKMSLMENIVKGRVCLLMRFVETF